MLRPGVWRYERNEFNGPANSGPRLPSAGSDQAGFAIVCSGAKLLSAQERALDN